MEQVESKRFTVGVFKDLGGAERGIEALQHKGFPPEVLSIISKEAPGVDALISRAIGAAGTSLDLPGLGPSRVAGPLIEALGGSDGDLGSCGLATALRLVGFQAHDGQLYHALVERGGVLVAVCSEPRAADALAAFHCYGGGNAAIGAWTGRL